MKLLPFIPAEARRRGFPHPCFGTNPLLVVILAKAVGPEQTEHIMWDYLKAGTEDDYGNLIPLYVYSINTPASHLAPGTQEGVLSRQYIHLINVDNLGDGAFPDPLLVWEVLSKNVYKI